MAAEDHFVEFQVNTEPDPEDTIDGLKMLECPTLVWRT